VAIETEVYARRPAGAVDSVSTSPGDPFGERLRSLDGGVEHRRRQGGR